MGKTLRSIPATLSPDGSVKLSEPFVVAEPTDAIVTIAIEDQSLAESALLSEKALDDWNRPEEDEAWEYLQEVI